MDSASSTHRTITLRGQYGFAKLNNDIFLVKLFLSLAPRTYQAYVFRHDFISVFPYSHTQTISHSDLLEVFEDENEKQRCWLDEETATVFVVQDVMSRFVLLKNMLMRTAAGRPPPTKRHPNRHSLDFRSRIAAV